MNFCCGMRVCAVVNMRRILHFWSTSLPKIEISSFQTAMFHLYHNFVVSMTMASSSSSNTSLFALKTLVWARNLLSYSSKHPTRHAKRNLLRLKEEWGKAPWGYTSLQSVRQQKIWECFRKFQTPSGFFMLLRRNLEFPVLWWRSYASHNVHWHNCQKITCMHARY